MRDAFYCTGPTHREKMEMGNVGEKIPFCHLLPTTSTTTTTTIHFIWVEENKRKRCFGKKTNVSAARPSPFNVFLNGPFPASFSLFSAFQYTVDSKQMFNKNIFLPLTGFEPWTFGIGSDRSTN